MAKTKLRLDDMLKEGKRIYIKNQTKPKGVLVINFVNPASGHSHTYEVAKTWIPLELSEAIPVDVIGQSLDLRAYVQKGLVALVDPDEAEEILSTEQARSELKRIHASKHSELAQTANEKEAVKKADEIDLKKATENEVNSQVRSMLLELDEDPTKEVEIVNRLQSIEDELTEMDLGYIRKEAESKKVRVWAKKALKVKAE